MKKVIYSLFVFCMIFSTVKISYAQVITATAEQQVTTKGPADITASATATAEISPEYQGYTITDKDRISYGSEGIEKCKKIRNCDKFTNENIKKSCNACCEVTGAVAKWDSEREQCVCSGKFQKFNTDKKTCETISQEDLDQILSVDLDVEIQESQSEETASCSDDLNIALTKLESQFSSNSEIMAQITQIITFCNDGDIINANILYAKLRLLIQAEYKRMETILNAVAELDEIKDGLKLTVWRDEEGNFNTTRLLSDSIAGVVLGTAGGLITSNVVKKNQVENGFEDIQCTVGGQVVAGWGDEFRVGIQ